MRVIRVVSASRGLVSRFPLVVLACLPLLAPGCAPRVLVVPGTESEAARLVRLHEAEPVAIVSALQRMKQDDPRAQVLLWSLGDKPGCVAGQKAEGLRFLAAADDDVFSAAAEVLQHCVDTEVEAALRGQARVDDAFRRYRAWGVLYWAGRDEVLGEMIAAVSDTRASTGMRTGLLRRMLSVDARALAPTYIELLADRDARVRYVASKELGLLAGTELGYRHRDSAAVNRESIGRWRRWYRERGSTLPRKWQRSGELGYVGIRLAASGGDLQIAEVIAGSGAERAGIRAGDVLHAVDHDAVAGKEVWALVMYELQGEPGTRVTLAVERPGVFRRRDFRVERGRWQVERPASLESARDTLDS
jgi:hypothetical protein